MKLGQFQEEEIRRLREEVAEDCSMDNWTQLGKVLLSRLISLNKRRGAEPAKMQLATYLGRSKWQDRQMEVVQNLSPIENKLLSRSVLV